MQCVLCESVCEELGDSVRTSVYVLVIHWSLTLIVHAVSVILFLRFSCIWTYLMLCFFFFFQQKTAYQV